MAVIRKRVRRESASRKTGRRGAVSREAVYRKYVAMKKKPLTPDERWDIVQAYHKALDDGEDEKAHALIVRIPLPAGLADAFKRSYGAQYLLESGYDLTEAVEEYGEGWLYEKV